MEQKNILKLLKNTESVPSTEKLSRELNSSSQARGRYSERLVEEILKQKGCNILYKNTRFYGIEVDILAQKEDLYILTEIKSINSQEHIENILKKEQKARLQSLVEALSLDLKKDTILVLALVDRQNKVSFFQL